MRVGYANLKSSAAALYFVDSVAAGDCAHPRSALPPASSPKQSGRSGFGIGPALKLALGFAAPYGVAVVAACSVDAPAVAGTVQLRVKTPEV